MNYTKTILYPKSERSSGSVPGFYKSALLLAIVEATNTTIK